MLDCNKRKKANEQTKQTRQDKTAKQEKTTVTAKKSRLENLICADISDSQAIILRGFNEEMDGRYI